MKHPCQFLLLLLVAGPACGDGPARYAVIEGRVTDLTGRGVAGATVLLRSPRTDIHRWPGALAGMEGAIRAQTDAQGHYRIGQAPSGRWYVAAIADGYAVGEYGMQTEWRWRFKIDPSAGDHLEDVDVVLPWSCELTGHCCDAGGDPLAGVVVFLRFQSATDGRSRGHKTARTDDAGRWRTGPCPIEGPLMVKLSARGPGRHRFEDREIGPLEAGATLDTGDWRALAIDPATASLHGVVERRDGGRLANTRVRVRDREVRVERDGSFRFDHLVPGKVRPRVSPREFRQPWTPGPLVELVADEDQGPIRVVIEPATTLTGRVLDDRGEPYPEAVVSAFPADASRVPGEELPRGSSDAQGAFLLEGVAPGEYVVTASHGSHPPHPEHPRVGARARVRAGAATTTLRLPRPYTVRYRAHVPGGLEARPEFASFPIQAFGGTFGDAVEEWRFRELARLEMQIHLASRARWIGVLDAPSRGATYDLGRIEFPEPSRIEGVVVDPNGKPVRYPKVHAVHLGTGVLVDSSRDRMFGDAHGRFVVERLPAGAYALFALVPGHALAVRARVEVGTGDPAEVRLVCRAPEPLQLRVTDPDGTPIERARLEYRLDGFPYRFEQDHRDFRPPSHGPDWTDADGRISRPLMARGRLDLRVHAEDFEDARLRIDEGDSRTLRIVLPRRDTRLR